MSCPTRDGVYDGLCTGADRASDEDGLTAVGLSYARGEAVGLEDGL